MTIDILPTLARLIDAPLPARKIDGLDLSPLILIGGKVDVRSPHEAFFFYWGNQLEAIRSGKWKMHFPHSYRSLGGKPGGRDGKPAPYANAETPLVLFDLEIDSGETTDVAAKHPDVVERLKKLADVARADLGDAATKQKGDGVREPGRYRPDPMIVGHRGLMTHAPENTLAGFAACLDLGLGFEVDVRRSKDGHLVCVHDDDLKRTTGAAEKVSDLTLAQLKKLDAGHGFDPVFAGQRVPTLDEVLTLVKERPATNALVALDFKDSDDATLPDTVKVAAKLGVLGKVVCIGKAIDSPEVRKKLKAADAKAPVAVLAQTAADLDSALADKDTEWAYVRFVPTAEQVAAAHKAGKRVFLVGSTVAGMEPDNWAKARAAGVDALLTDHPLECRRSWRPPAK